MSDPAATPIVSVVMPAYNGVALIGETLDNLRDQTMPDFEVIVVDDCSTDETRALIASWPDPRVRLVALEKNGGPVRARNRGAAEARGRYIAGLDQDDLSRPDRFARQIAHFEAHPDVVLVGAAAEQLVDGAIRPMAYPTTTTPALIAWLSWIENPLVWSSVMVRTDAARRLDPFTRPDILYAEDFDLYHRMQRLGRIARLDTPLTIYRQHAGGVSKRFADTMAASATRVLAEAHADRLGVDAAAVAAALVAHNMAKRPVETRETLALIGDALVRLERRFLADHAPDSTDRRLIAAETEYRWTAIRRAALRSGTLGLDDIKAAGQPSLEASGTNSPAMVGVDRRRPPRASDLGGKDHPARAEQREHLIEIAFADREAALAATEHAMRLDHVGVRIPGGVDHDRAAQRIGIRLVEPDQSLRIAVLADVVIGGEEGAPRSSRSTRTRSRSA